MKRFLAWLAAIAGLLAIAFALLRTPDLPADELKVRYGSPASQFVELRPGFTVHLRDEGPKDAPAIILVHGSNASLHTWEPWVARLTPEFRVVSLDLQGHGLTGADPEGCYSAACMAATVEAVRSHLGLDGIAIAGNSMGGGVAWTYALAHPGRVTALVLVDSGGARIKRQGPPPLGFRIAMTPGLRELGQHITPRSVIEKTLEASVSVKSVASPAAVDRYWELLRYPGNRAATMERFSATPVRATTQRLAALRQTPVLILWGEEDALIPVASARWFKTALPHAELIIYPAIGHLPQEEVADQSAADVAAFLRRVTPAAG